MSKIVIIGGVAGGATFAARLRRLNENHEIIMFEKDEYIAFANCGLPYYIGEVIKNRDDLILQTVTSLSTRYNLDVRNFSEVTAINTSDKTVEVYNHQTKQTYFESYDKLVYSTGASPIIVPFKSLGTTTNCFTLRNIPDADKIYNYIKVQNVQTAVVIGAGFIGVEMAENLAHRGIKVTLIDRNESILNTFDLEMSAQLELSLKSAGVDILLNQSVTDVSQNEVSLENLTIKTDLTIMAIGVQPNSSLAIDAGLMVNESKHLVVSKQFQTSNEDIYAIGDVVAIENFITNKQVSIPLAWPANRQARLLADIFEGGNVEYTGSLGVAICKVVDYTAASVGLTEKEAIKQGYDVTSVIVHRANHASYYPGSSIVSLKVIFDKISGKIFGAQAIGIEGVDKRIDVIATAIKAGMKVDELADIELCYAPPYSSAKDPVNILGYAASNIMEDTTKVVTYDQIDGAYLLDVRTNKEFSLGNIHGAINLPIDELRTSIDKLPTNKDSKIVVYCQVGLRGYSASLILQSLGYTNVYNLSGGYLTYSTYMNNKLIQD